eukprot:CAMPEP_0178991714 /NCGR_PEP_ID=MMETSP0795-20121207/5692_1 /TAXON_ID=88552 /ORGANISM="Amoebophrya sp., Strain Ameob2" /LENGTH=265 /DNA_ID=CAMNT_0020683475 /DNA_START=175 /DNA_END=972 /DNA_ORIENTATION=-
MRVGVACTFIGSVAGFTAFNSPNAPGNYGLPAETPGFTGEIARGLPEVNVRYKYPVTDASSVLSAVQGKLAMDARIAADASEISHDQSVLSLLAPSSFLRKGGEDALLTSMSSMGTGPQPDTSGISAFREMMLGMSHSPRPHLQPANAATTACPKSYSGCPSGFADQNGACVATSYSGPCGKGPFNFGAMSVEGKMRFEGQCGAVFPCSSGARSYTSACPAGFRSAGSMCEPTASYSGPCGAQSFAGYNAAMLKAWESKCGAYFA